MKQCAYCKYSMNDFDAVCPRCGRPAARPYPPDASVALKNDGWNFVNTWVGVIVLLGLLIFFMAIGGVMTPHFFTGANMINVLAAATIPFMLALAMVLTVHAKGPDFSFAIVMGISTVVMHVAVSNGATYFLAVIFALIVAAAIGACNGLLSAYTKIPAALVTIITAAIGYAVISFAGRLVDSPVQAVDFPEFSASINQMVSVMFVVALVGVFLLAWLMKLPGPAARDGQGERPVKVVLCYVTSSLMAAFAAFYLVSRIKVIMVTGTEQYIYLTIFIVGAIYSSRFFDNKIFAVFFALAPAFLWAIINNVRALLGLSSYFMMIIQVGMAAGFAIIAYFIQRKGPYNLFKI